MRPVTVTALLLCLALPLAACAPEPRPEAPAPHAVADPQADSQADAEPDEARLLARINTLVNDTDPEAPAFAALQAELGRHAEASALPAELRLLLAQVRDFAAPRLGGLWREQRQAREAAAELYSRSAPPDTQALAGAKVARRLGPALYLVRLPGGDTAFLATPRKLKTGASLRGIPTLEQVERRPGEGVVEGDLDDGGAPAKTYVEVGREQQRRFQAERAPALERLRQLQDGHVAFDRTLQGELARWDAFVREVNEQLAPRLLSKAALPAPARLVKSVKRLGKSWSRDQYYRYALPVTGRAEADALTSGYLEGRKKDVLGLLRSTGVGRGRLRANMDLISFKAQVAGPALLSLLFEAYRDTGGAHGNYSYKAFVFDLKAGRALGLAELFTDVPAALAVASDLAARRFAMTMGGAPFPEGHAPTPENFQVFTLDGDDITFTFAPYQVASFAQGTQTLRIPLFHPRLLPLLGPALLQARAG